MEENQLIEKILQEAKTIEIPSELEPEQIRARIGEKKEQAGKQLNRAEKFTKKGFRFQSNRARIAVAAIVLVASLGAYGIADSRMNAPAKEQVMEKEEVPPADTVNQPEAPSVEATEVKEEEPVRVLGDYHLASGYDEVRDMLGQLALLQEKNTAYGVLEEAAAEASLKKEYEAVDGASMSNSQITDLQNKQEYSATNLQVTGVDESDIVKTDGRYIYIASNDKVQIVDTQEPTPRQLADIQPDFEGNMDCIREMYVADDRLLLIIQTEDTDGLADTDSVEPKMMKDVAYAFGWSNQVHTKVLTYDITDPGAAQLIGTFTQDGAYHTSRKIGDQLFVCTDYGYPVSYPYLPLYRADGSEDGVQPLSGTQEKSLTRKDVEDNLPKIQGQTIPENCIYLPKDGTERGALVVSMNVKEPEKTVDQKLIFCGYSTLYVTRDTLLIYCTDYDMASDRNRTKLTKFAIGDGKITARCAESVPGYIQDTFAIHENKDGYIYVLTTDYTQNGTTNQLYVLDDRLKISGRIEHIADGEDVYAARFVDEIGYFVTYRNMDPLFTVDFSDPGNPKLIGELEIPGFSDYLQFWDDTHLIGVGEERKEKDSEFVGIKVSLYDISDPTAVKESDKYVMDDAWYAPAQHNYKALLADSSKNIIAFMTCDKDEDAEVSLRVFTVVDGKLKMAAKDVLQQENGYYAADNYRNLYIRDKLYLAREGLLLVYDMKQGFERVAACNL